MKLTRREFLLAGLSALSFAMVSKSLRGHTHERSQIPLDSLTPLPAETPLLRFVAVGDTGAGNQGQLAIARAIERYQQQYPFDLAILTGDNIYNNGEISKIGRAFEQPYKNLLSAGVKFYACLGNHDIRSKNGNDEVQYPGFNMQGRYYTIRRDPVQFFILDTNHNANWIEQLTWLQGQLRDSDALWKIVVGHHPLYTSGLHHANSRLRRRLLPILSGYQVPLYINGHNHNYERTIPIDGTTYLTCGAGAKTRRVGVSYWTARSLSRLSFATVDVYGDRLIISGIDDRDRIFDRAEITRS